MINKKQKQLLRALGNSVKASVQIGKEGLNENVLDMCERSLVAHELIKVAILKNCPVTTQEIALDISAKTHAEIIHVIGRTILFYRQSDKRIIKL